MFLFLALGVPPALPTDSAKAENNVICIYITGVSSSVHFASQRDAKRKQGVFTHVVK